MAKASDGQANLEKNPKDAPTPKERKEKKGVSGEATLLAPWLDHLVESEMIVPDYPPIQGRLVAMSRYDLADLSRRVLDETKTGSPNIPGTEAPDRIGVWFHVSPSIV